MKRVAMEAYIEHLKGVPIIRVEGHIDMNNYVEVHEMILKEIRSGHTSIILNFRKLDFMDSATLGMLLRSLDKTRQKGGVLVLVTNPLVDRILSVTGLTNLFDVFSDEKDAIESLAD
jgi:anti-anti-sigma factor